MMSRLFVLFFSLAQILSVHSLYSLTDKAKKAHALMEEFDAMIQKAMHDYHVPGLSIGVVVDGSLIYAKGFGFRDLEKKLPVTKDTLFPIGSCSKAFTSFVMGSFVDEGFLSWDEPIVNICPDFRLSDPYATQHITMRDILSHRSGLPRHDFMWYNSEMTRNEVIQKLRYLEPSCCFRERYQYNNLMYLVAGHVAEELSGKAWEELVREKILQPLDMRRTNFSVKAMQEGSDFACPYIEKNDRLEKMKFRDISLIGPAGAINSSVEDLSHWMIMQLNGGVYHGTSCIRSSTLQEIHTPQVTIPGSPEVKESFLYSSGLGWLLASYRGQYVVSHDGVSDGFTSTVGILPKQGIGVVVLANRNLTSLPRFLFLQVVDRLLELPFLDHLQEGLETVRKNKYPFQEKKDDENHLRKKGTTPSHLLENFMGEYEHPGYGTVFVDLINGDLSLTFHGISCLLKHWHYDVFEMKEESEHTFFSREGTKLSFRNNMKGDVEELLIPFEPNVGDIVFKKKKESLQVSYLKQFVGLYEIYGYTVEMVIRNQALCAIIPGQPVYELIPSGQNEFLVQAMPGNTVRFVLDDDDQVQELVLIRPYGAFTAKPKKM